ncbi:unnamed protein product [Thelazia callipaeda]|uniref:Ima1_N domain-containing protein n=1 Tax=Thelazia callipaeda TaxID=103827 RepID=A0A0N5CLB0_THECL|nr:unnamed protein product [Thelazia callipaeda]
MILCFPNFYLEPVDDEIHFRPYWKKTVNCWFCNENVRVPYQKYQAFVCPSCEQYNGFKEDGDYDRFIPEQKYEFLNPKPNNKASKTQESMTKNGLCQRCNIRQASIQSQINKFEPENELNFDDEFEVYKKRLHKNYPLCMECEHVVQKKFKLDEFEKVAKHGCNRMRRHRASLFNCGPVSNCLNLVTFSTSCCLCIIYLLQLQSDVHNDLFEWILWFPCHMLSSRIHFLVFYNSKLILLGLISHATSVSLMHTRRSLPDIVAFCIWCLLLLWNIRKGEKQDLFSQLSLSSVLCLVSFAVAFLPRKLLHRKRSNNIIKSAFSIASTPLSQCSTISTNTSSGNQSLSKSILDKSTSSKTSTPTRELGKLFDSLSLGADFTPSLSTSSVQRRRGPFDSMKKPVLAEPRLRIPSVGDRIFLGRELCSSRYVNSFSPSTCTSAGVTDGLRKFTVFSVLCVVGTLFSVSLNAVMFYKLFYHSRS